MTHRLTPDIASRFAGIALGHVRQEYPHKLDHVMDGPEDVRGPKALHPIFFGSFDWHSCVHGYWLLARLLRRRPDMPENVRIRTLLDEMITPDKVAGELAYLDRAYSGGFERPYGWAWLLALHGELAAHDAPWGGALEPLALAFAERFRLYLPRLTYPIRVGTHFNTSFALTLTHEWAAAHDPALADLIAERALGWFGEDRDCQAWEPSGDDFLSSALSEALLMSRVTAPADFAAWFAAFLPETGEGRPATLFAPAFVSDRGDGKIAHLDGLNLSRAWCWRAIAARLDSRPSSARMAAAADAHLDASLPHLDDDYMGSHWLATFALLALEAGG